MWLSSMARKDLRDLRDLKDLRDDPKAELPAGTLLFSHHHHGHLVPATF